VLRGVIFVLKALESLVIVDHLCRSAVQSYKYSTGQGRGSRVAFQIMDLISWTFNSSIDDKDRPVSRYSAYLSGSILTEQLLIDASDTSRFLSYNQLLSHVRRLVAGLQAVGVQQGDCVCVSSFNDVSRGSYLLTGVFH
jgi:hypothetical protein